MSDSPTTTASPAPASSIGAHQSTLWPMRYCFLHIPVLVLVSWAAGLPESSYLQEFARVFVYLFALYYGITGALYLVFYSPWSPGGARGSAALFPRIGRKIQPGKVYVWAVARMEIGWSLVTVFTGSSLVAVVTWLHANGRTNLYWAVSDYGVGWLLVSGAAMIAFNDLWMYWGHYLLHSPAGFRGVHKVHHRFFAPTPFSTMAFHPVEALIMFGPVVGAVVFPMYIPLLLLVSLIFFLVSIFEHLGYSLPYYDALDGVVSTPIHHDLHHSLYNCNYGVYLCFWDRFMGTYVGESREEEEAATVHPAAATM